MSAPEQAGADHLWALHQATGDIEVRNRLVLRYAPLVKYVAGRLRAGLPDNVDQADLLSEGVIGLMDAIEKFDPTRGLQFQTYAVPRIRGAIVDSLRAADWVPRSVRNALRDLQEAQTRLEQTLGRSPDEEELAAELGVSVAEVRDLSARGSYARLASLDEIPPSREPAAWATQDALENDDTRETLLRAITSLPERDQVIVALYYFERLTLAEIGHVLGVTESRVSQLHSRITSTLRTRMLAAEAA